MLMPGAVWQQIAYVGKGIWNFHQSVCVYLHNKIFRTIIVLIIHRRSKAPISIKSFIHTPTWWHQDLIRAPCTLESSGRRPQRHIDEKRENFHDNCVFSSRGQFVKQITKASSSKNRHRHILNAIGLTNYWTCPIKPEGVDSIQYHKKCFSLRWAR